MIERLKQPKEAFEQLKAEKEELELKLSRCEQRLEDITEERKELETKQLTALRRDGHLPTPQPKSDAAYVRSLVEAWDQTQAQMHASHDSALSCFGV